jgi:hypothetical protein
VCTIRVQLRGSNQQWLHTALLTSALVHAGREIRLTSRRAFDMFAKPIQSRKGVINKDVLRQALLEYGSSAASEKEIHKLVELLPACEGGATNEFDYAKHVNLFMG